MTPEIATRRQICSWLTTKRQFCFFWVNDSVGIFDPKSGRYRRNVDPYRILGVADILGIWTGKDGVGRFLAIEVKRPKLRLGGKIVQTAGSLSKEQRVFLEEIERRGGYALCAWGIDDVKAYLEAKGEI